MRSRYVRDEKETAELLSIFKSQTYAMNAINFFYETKHEAIATVLPPPLEPVDSSVVTMQFASLPGTPVGCVGAWIPCKYKDTAGYYCVHMAFNADFAIIFGRESIGEPKKYADVTVLKQGSHLEAHVVRLGKEYITMVGELEGPGDNGMLSKDFPIFYYKYLHACDGSGLEFDPILVKAQMTYHYESVEHGQGEVKYTHSDHDFIEEFEVIKPLGAFYSSLSVDVTTKRLAMVPAKEFLPYSFAKLDDYRLFR